MISLITASQQSLSAEAEDITAQTFFPSRKQYFINRVPTAGSEEQSSGTSLWIISTARDKPTALGHQQLATVAENNEEKVLSALGICNRAFHK